MRIFLESFYICKFYRSYFPLILQATLAGVFVHATVFMMLVTNDKIVSGSCSPVNNDLQKSC